MGNHRTSRITTRINASDTEFCVHYRSTGQTWQPLSYITPFPPSGLLGLHNTHDFCTHIHTTSAALARHIGFWYSRVSREFVEDIDQTPAVLMCCSEIGLSMMSCAWHHPFLDCCSLRRVHINELIGQLVEYPFDAGCRRRTIVVIKFVCIGTYDIALLSAHHPLVQV